MDDRDADARRHRLAFGAAVRELRARRGFSQEESAFAGACIATTWARSSAARSIRRCRVILKLCEDSGADGGAGGRLRASARRATPAMLAASRERAGRPPTPPPTLSSDLSGDFSGESELSVGGVPLAPRQIARGTWQRGRGSPLLRTGDPLPRPTQIWVGPSAGAGLAGCEGHSGSVERASGATAAGWTEREAVGEAAGGKGAEGRWG